MTFESVDVNVGLGYVCDRFCEVIKRFSHDLEMKTREQNRNNKRTEIELFDWSIERIQTRVAFRWLNERSDEKTSCLFELSRNHPLRRLHVMLQQCLLHIRVFFSLAGKRRGHVLIFSSIGC